MNIYFGDKDIFYQEYYFLYRVLGSFIIYCGFIILVGYFKSKLLEHDLELQYELYLISVEGRVSLQNLLR